MKIQRVTKKDEGKKRSSDKGFTVFIMRASCAAEKSRTKTWVKLEAGRIVHEKRGRISCPLRTHNFPPLERINLVFSGQ
jgi:hypothetical protein